MGAQQIFIDSVYNLLSTWSQNLSPARWAPHPVSLCQQSRNQGLRVLVPGRRENMYSSKSSIFLDSANWELYNSAPSLAFRVGSSAGMDDGRGNKFARYFRQSSPIVTLIGLVSNDPENQKPLANENLCGQMSPIQMETLCFNCRI